MHRIGLLIFALLIISQNFSVTAEETVEKEVMTLIELMDKAMTVTNSGEVIIENKRITIDTDLTRPMGLYNFLSKKYRNQMDVPGGFVIVPNKLTILDCVFENGFTFYKTDFSKGLEITQSQLVNVSINSCIVNGPVRIEDNNESVRKGEIKLEGTEIKGELVIGNNKVFSEVIKDCDIQLLGEFDEFNHFGIPGSIPGDLEVKNNVIIGGKHKFNRVIFHTGEYLKLDVRENEFCVNVFFLENKVEERFFLADNVFDKHVSFENFLFSEIWNELYWDQLDGHKLQFGGSEKLDGSGGYGGPEPDFSKKTAYHNLINIYKGMHTIFTARGNLKSANACYSEMKGLQGEMLKYIYETESISLFKTWGNFFRWRLNQLLKFYTNHGTDPGLAVVMSCYVIIGFSVFYIFFPSEWDVNSKAKFFTGFDNCKKSKGKAAFGGAVLVMGGTLIIAIINAITLSINSFVTLGFGSIPTNGFARDLCIVEGFIGWFLLSIFSVALINQVLA